MAGILVGACVAHAGCGRVAFDPGPGGDGASDAYAAAVLGDAPVAYWRLGETSGTVARDEIGGHPGTYQGQCHLGVAGALTSSDTAVEFDGTSCRIVIGDAFPFQGSAPFTMELWAKIGLADGSSRFLINRDVAMATVHAGYQLPFQGNALWFERLVGSAGDGYVDSGAPQLGRFEMIAVTFDGSTNHFYRDGSEVASAVVTMPIQAASGGLVFGDTVDGVTFKLLGVLDEIAFYDKPLAAARVAAHYAAR